MNNLNNLSDDELDKLFRHSAEESNVEFDEGAWDKMRSILEEKQPSKKPFNWNKSTLALLALLFVGISTIYFGKTIVEKHNSKSKNIIVGSEKNTNSLVENENIHTKINNIHSSEYKLKTANTNANLLKNSNAENIKPEISFNKNESIENKSLTGISTVNTTIKIPKNKGDLIPNEKVIKRNLMANNPDKLIDRNIEISEYVVINSNDAINKHELTENKSKISPAINSSKTPNLKLAKNANNSTNKLEKNNNPFLKNKLIFSNNASENNKKLSPEKTNNVENVSCITEPEKVDEIRTLPTISVQYLKPIDNYIYIKPIFNVAVKELNLPIPTPKPIEFFKKGLSFRAMVSPDLSTVGSNKIDKMGSNFGGLIEYRFGKRLVLQTGLIKSVKKYDAYPEQYTWVWGMPASKLMEIGANCKMLDIPINLRYDIVANTKTRIFTSAGLTSYNMRNETYHYDYEDNTNPNLKRHNWSGKTGTYKMSNLNLSVGFEKQISKSFTMQVEPFVKSPLKSIGFGKVPLITYGLMFSVNCPLNNLIKK
jgi:hypothetical protein